MSVLSIEWEWNFVHSTYMHRRNWTSFCSCVVVGLLYDVCEGPFSDFTGVLPSIHLSRLSTNLKSALHMANSRPTCISCISDNFHHSPTVSTHGQAKNSQKITLPMKKCLFIAWVTWKKTVEEQRKKMQSCLPLLNLLTWPSITTIWPQATLVKSVDSSDWLIDLLDVSALLIGWLILKDSVWICWLILKDYPWLVGYKIKQFWGLHLQYL